MLHFFRAASISFLSFLLLHISFYSVFKVQQRFTTDTVKAFVVGLGGLEPPTSRLSGVRSNHLSYKPMLVFGDGRRFRLPTPFGGDEEDRTPDPLLARQVLSQLSYTPV